MAAKQNRISAYPVNRKTDAVVRYRLRQNERIRMRLDTADDITRYHLKQIIRLNERKIRTDADEEDIDWITVNGSHIPLIDGEAVGGAEGNLTGEDFSEAESVDTEQKSSAGKKSESTGSQTGGSSSGTAGSIAGGARISAGGTGWADYQYGSGQSDAGSVVTDETGFRSYLNLSGDTYLDLATGTVVQQDEIGIGSSGTAVSGTKSGQPMTYEQFDEVYSSTSVNQAKAIKNMSASDAMRYFEYIGSADEDVISELRQAYESGDDSTFNAVVNACVDSAVGSNFQNGSMIAKQKAEYLKICDDPVEFLETYGTTEEEAALADRLTDIWSSYWHGSDSGADTMEEAWAAAIDEAYSEQMQWDQENLVSALSGCSDSTYNMIGQLSGLCDDLYQQAVTMYENGAPKKDINQLIADYCGMPVKDFNSQVYGEGYSDGSPEASLPANSSWLMTSDGKFKFKDHEFSPSSEADLNGSDYAIGANGHIYKNDGTGNFTDTKTQETVSAKELAESTALKLPAEGALMYEGQIAYELHDENMEPGSVNCTHKSVESCPETFLGTYDSGAYPWDTANNDIKRQMQALEVINDLGVDYETALDCVDAIAAFTDGYYIAVRDIQTNGEDSELYSAAAEKYGEDMEEYIAAAPKWSGEPIYRGVGLDKNDYDSLMEQVSNGEEISQKGVSSWSSKESTAQEFAGQGEYMVVFVCKKGTKLGTSIKHLSKIESEDEILVSEKARHVAVKTYRKKEPGGRMVTYIEAEEVES